MCLPNIHLKQNIQFPESKHLQFSDEIMGVKIAGSIFLTKIYIRIML